MAAGWERETFILLPAQRNPEISLRGQNLSGRLCWKRLLPAAPQLLTKVSHTQRDLSSSLTLWVIFYRWESATVLCNKPASLCPPQITWGGLQLAGRASSLHVECPRYLKPRNVGMIGLGRQVDEEEVRG